MMSPLSRLSNKLGRNVMANFVRNHSHGGVPGENLPFDIANRYKLTAYFIVFVGSGLSAPFLITRHQLLKKTTLIMSTTSNQSSATNATSSITHILD